LPKSLADRHYPSFPPFLGIDPELGEGSVPLRTEPTVPGVGTRRPGRVYLLADGSLLDLEFQSAAANAEIFRFILYGAMLLYGAMRAGENPKPDRDVSIRFTVVYTGGLGKRPRHSCPDESRRGEGNLHFKLDQVFLEERLAMADVILEYRTKIEDWKPDAGVFRLTPSELVRLYLAPLGQVPEAPWETGAECLALGRDLSAMTGDWNIHGLMLTSVIARVNICTDETLAGHREVQDKMGPNVVGVFDTLTNGNYSRLEEANKSLEGTNKSLEGMNKSLEVTVKSLEGMNKSLEVTVKSLAAEN
jgi:hypothetical protein